MPAKVGHFVIGSRDVPKAAEFYGRLFGWNTTPEEANTNLRIETGGKINGHLVPAEEHGFSAFFIGVDDLEATLALVSELGGCVVAPVEVNARGTRFAMIADRDNNILGVFQRKPRETNVA